MSKQKKVHIRHAGMSTHREGAVGTDLEVRGEKNKDQECPGLTDDSEAVKWGTGLTRG